VTALGWPDTSSASGYGFRVALASVAPTPLEVVEVHEFLASQPPGPAAFKQAAQLAAESCQPIDDVRGSARYRKAMVHNLTEKALQKTWQSLQGGA
jgi:CO/xanthine dehydrogenase FAD-binding subunit